MLLCQPGVATGMSPLRTDGFWRQLTFHLCGGTHNHRVRRDIVRHHSAGSNQCALPNDNTVQNNRTDADEASILQTGAMDYGAMADGHFRTDVHRLTGIAMQDGPILNIAVRADSDLAQISTDNRCWPEAAAFLHHDLPDQDSTCSNPGRRVELRRWPWLFCGHQPLDRFTDPLTCRVIMSIGA